MLISIKSPGISRFRKCEIPGEFRNIGYFGTDCLDGNLHKFLGVLSDLSFCPFANIIFSDIVAIDYFDGKLDKFPGILNDLPSLVFAPKASEQG